MGSRLLDRFVFEGATDREKERERERDRETERERERRERLSEANLGECVHVVYCFVHSMRILSSFSLSRFRCCPSFCLFLLAHCIHMTIKA